MTAPWSPALGALVIIDGRPGVFRVERLVAEGVRALSYVDGSLITVPLNTVKACPPGTRAGLPAPTNVDAAGVASGE